MSNKKSVRSKNFDTKKDRELQKKIKERAAYSLAILGKAFVRHGSGRFLNIRAPKPKE
jgi:hypothetical protein